MNALLNASWAVAAELVVLSLAGFIFFRRRGNTLAEACAYGLVTPLMTLSFFLQLSFMARLPVISLVCEIPLALWAAVYVAKHRRVLKHGWRSTRAMCSANPLACASFGVILIYLAAQATLIPPAADDWLPLGQVLAYGRHHSVISTELHRVQGSFLQTSSPVNALILTELFLRFKTDMGIGLLGFTAYLSIGFSAYALSRRYAWQPIAATVSVIVISMPRLVFLATSPGFEIIPVAAALFCLLAAFRAIESPNLTDFYLLFLGILFMMSGTIMNRVFPLVLIPLSGLLLFRRHGVATWRNMISARPHLMLICLLPAAIFSQLWLILPGIADGIANSAASGSSAIEFNDDGIQGAGANALRYFLQSIHFTQPVDSLLNWATGFSLTGALQKINDRLILPIFGIRGAATNFYISWLPNARMSWFGPFGVLLILPAVNYAVRRAPRRLKAVSVALVGYFFLVSLIPAWRPENARYFDVFFVCGGICTAFFLPPWRLGRNRRRALVVISAILMLYAGLCNEQKPAIGQLAGEGSVGVWQAAGWGLNRSWTAKAVYGDDRLETAHAVVADENHLWLIYTDFALAYPFLLTFPNAGIISSMDLIPETAEDLRKANAEFLMFIDCPTPTWIEHGYGEMIWHSVPGHADRPGHLLQFH